MTSAARRNQHSSRGEKSSHIYPLNLREPDWVPELVPLALEEKLQADASALRVWQLVRLGDPRYDLEVGDAEYERRVRRFTNGGRR